MLYDFLRHITNQRKDDGQSNEQGTRMLEKQFTFLVGREYNSKVMREKNDLRHNLHG